VPCPDALVHCPHLPLYPQPLIQSNIVLTVQAPRPHVHTCVQAPEALLHSRSDSELWGTAIHEAGHTVAAWYLNPAFAVEKVGLVCAESCLWPDCCGDNMVTQAGGW
jgi:hypothetical protein